MLCEDLDDTQRMRLQALEDDIDQSFMGDEETAKKILAIKNKPDDEKLELMSAIVPITEAGDTGLSRGMQNAFTYGNDESKRM